MQDQTFKSELIRVIFFYVQDLSKQLKFHLHGDKTLKTETFA